MQQSWKLWYPLSQKITGIHVQRNRKFFNNGDGRVPPPSFDVADIGPVNVGAIGIVFLTPALLDPQSANISSKARAYIHAELKTRLSPIDLQTISHNCVDCHPTTGIGRCH